MSLQLDTLDWILKPESRSCVPILKRSQKRRATVLARGAVLACNGGAVNTKKAFEIEESNE